MPFDIAQYYFVVISPVEPMLVHIGERIQQRLADGEALLVLVGEKSSTFVQRPAPAADSGVPGTLPIKLDFSAIALGRLALPWRTAAIGFRYCQHCKGGILERVRNSDGEPPKPFDRGHKMRICTRPIL